MTELEAAYSRAKRLLADSVVCIRAIASCPNTNQNLPEVVEALAVENRKIEEYMNIVGGLSPRLRRRRSAK